MGVAVCESTWSLLPPLILPYSVVRLFYQGLLVDSLRVSVA